MNNNYTTTIMAASEFNSHLSGDQQLRTVQSRQIALELMRRHGKEIVRLFGTGSPSDGKQEGGLCRATALIRSAWAHE
jgi:hypothetical protein